MVKTMPRKKTKRKRTKRKTIHKHPAYRWVPGVLNFFVWGLGYIVDKRYSLGLLWLAVYFSTYMAINLIGVTWYFATTPGNLLFLSHIVISIILLLDGIGGKGKKKH